MAENIPFQSPHQIYYINNKPHIGNAYTLKMCDVKAQFMKFEWPGSILFEWHQ
jgi:hypothetical protein